MQQPKVYKSSIAGMNDASVIEKLVGPDMKRRTKKAKRNQVFFFIMIFVCFFGFGFCGFAMTMGWLPLPIMFIPFVGFPIFGVLSGTSGSKVGMCNRIVFVMDYINGKDRELIVRIPVPGLSEETLRYTVQRLIETGNLKGYVIIANVMVASVDSYTSEDYARGEYQKYREDALLYQYTQAAHHQSVPPIPTPVEVQAPEKETYSGISQNRDYGEYNPWGEQEKGKCRSCGAEIGEGVNYCPKCGTRIL